MIQDSYIDFPDDLGCDNFYDNNESNGPIECDQDSDCGSTTFINDCSNLDYLTIWTIPKCQLQGTEQSFCINKTVTDSESCNHICEDNNGCDFTECSDNIDNDQDSYIDFPDDLGCDNYYDNDESDGVITCSNNLQCGNPSTDHGCQGLNFTATTTTPTCFEQGTEQSYCNNITSTDTETCNNICDNSLGCDYTECSDTIDNDQDSYIDFPDDLGCDNFYDNNESDGPIGCNQNSDCGDISINNLCFMLDYITTITTPSCNLPGTEHSYCSDEEEILTDECNHICSNTEGCDYTQCSDSLDNDQDSYIDFPDDLGCDNFYDNDESDGTVTCNNNLECGNPTSEFVCSGLDYIENTTKPICFNAGTEQSYCDDILETRTEEVCNNICDKAEGCDYTECSDGVDNDNDNYIDFPADSGCDNFFDDSEFLDTIPEIFVSSNVTQGVIPLSILFNCQGVGGNEPLSYVWDFGDNTFSTDQIVEHTYTIADNYTAVCTVTDNDGDHVSASIDITAIPRVIEITELSCFDHVIADNNQSCSIFVKNSLGLGEPDVDVTVYYLDGTLFGTCITDDISGGL